MHTQNQRLLAALGYLLRKPVKALKAIHRDRFAPRYWEAYVAERYATSPALAKGLPQVDILDLFPEFEETVTPFAMLEASATPMDVALLKQLARRFEHCDYLEIGRWRAESLVNVASVARSAVSLSLSPEQMRETGFDRTMIGQDGFFINRMAATPNIECINCDTQTFDFASLGRKFDLIFVDGDHHSAAVRHDTRNVFNLLRDERSVIVWHDYAESPERVRWPVYAGILDGCPEELRGNLCHVSNTLCALFTREPLNTRHRSFAMTPQACFEVSLRGHRLPPVG